jgi:TctA family transporter
MFYKFLAIAADFIPMAIALAGIIMLYKQPQKENHLKATLVLLGVGFIGTGILSWTRVHNETMHAHSDQSTNFSVSHRVTAFRPACTRPDD